MKSEENKLLNDWILQQSEFSKNDLLVTINQTKTIPFSETLSLESISKIISISQNSIKESGINPFCQIIGTLNWEWNNQEVQTPIWIIPCAFKLDKVRKLVHLFPDEEAGFLNPFLFKKIMEIYDLQLSETDLETVIQELKTAGFNNIDTGSSVVGNFHHHRYVLLKELQELATENKLSSGLRQFLSGEKSEKNPLLLTDEALLPYDTDHRSVFELFETENCVVQGPPGTGKSQLLTNIIGKLLISCHSNLFVSEKRAALEVIQKRLSSIDLEQFSVISTDDLAIHDFIADLKKTWKFLDEYIPPAHIEFSTRKEQESNLQFILDILNQPELIGGISFSKFNELLLSLDNQTKKTSPPPIPPNTSTSSVSGGENEFHFLANPPLLTDYEQTLQTVQKIYDAGIDKSCSILPYQALKESNLSHFISNIEKTSEVVAVFEKVQTGFTVNDLDKLQYLSVVHQLFQNELAKKYVAITEPESKAQKQFVKLNKEYKRIEKQEALYADAITGWKAVPSKMELEYLVELAESKSIFKKIKFKKRWSKYSDLPVKYALKSIEHLKKHLSVQQEKINIEGKLTKIGITHFDEMDALKASLHLFSREKWDVYANLSSEQRKLLDNIGAMLTFLKNDLTYNYRLRKNSPIILQLNDLKKHLPQLMILEKELKNLNQQIMDALSFSDSFTLYQQNVLKTHQTNFQSHYPALSAFEPNYLKEKAEALIDSEKKENQLTAEKIRILAKEKFESYNKLLNTLSVKLTEEQKRFKQQLKKGKSILIKEFSKTRQHPTLRELMNSEAFIWIRLLKPVWLTNPVQLAKTFSLEKELFDVCIMDEASQIPIQNAVGALQRSKRMIIAGDEQQMNPTSYFQAGKKEITSVLQHASYYLPKVTLTHHYRSKHAPLISFSNRYFYDYKLVVYPSFPMEHNCIIRHFCFEGKYIERKNQEEAEKVAAIIRNRLKTNKTIGVAAFSQEQIDSIWKSLPSELIEEIETRIEANTFFIKPLEKVQGDECEHLIISLGYAPNEDGNFHLRFGPLNTESGRNRLNVLFSRASDSIDFVCSIESASIQWSENESIQLLYKWMKNLETTQDQQKISFPLELTPEVNENQLKLKDCYSIIPDAREFLTTYSVLKNRGWDILFV